MKLGELKEKHPRAFHAAYTTWREGEGDPCYDWYDMVLEQAVVGAAERGFTIRNESRSDRTPEIYFGFYQQGSGASWVGSVDITEWAAWVKGHESEPGKERLTPVQMLWLEEALRNDAMTYTVRITTGNGSYPHSGSMNVSYMAECVQPSETDITQGIFAGMSGYAFNTGWETHLSDINEIILKAARDFADELYRTLQDEFEWLTGEEYFMEAKSDVEYDEEGNEHEREEVAAPAAGA